MAIRDYRSPDIGSAYPGSVLLAEAGFIFARFVTAEVGSLFCCPLPNLDSPFCPCYNDFIVSGS